MLYKYNFRLLKKVRLFILKKFQSELGRYLCSGIEAAEAAEIPTLFDMLQLNRDSG